VARPATLVFSGFLVLLCTAIVDGREWTRFRGPNGQGISHAQSIPITWTEKDFNWKVQLPGGGHSSPVVWANLVFVTCERPKPLGGILLALDVRTGQVAWQRQYDLTAYRPHADNSYAAATPAVDANAVYVLWQTAQETIVAALDHQGRELWRRDRPGTHSQFGPGASPMLAGDVVVFTREQEGEEKYRSEWVALDRKTGQTRWTIQRKNTEISCSTPCLYQPPDGKAQLIFTSETDGITGVDPTSGAVLWEARSVLPARVVGSPVIAGDLVISACGKGGTGNQLVAVRIPSPGEGNQPKIAYTQTGRLIPYVPTSLAKDGLLYVFHDQGEVRCLRVETGEVLWSHKPAGRFYGSPVWVNGRLYGIDRQGNVVVLRAGPTYELLAVNPLGEKSHATPAVADGVMYLRTESHLISLGGRKN
jgi:outer membrane protein assembly factor BamB